MSPSLADASPDPAAPHAPAWKPASMNPASWASPKRLCRPLPVCITLCTVAVALLSLGISVLFVAKSGAPLDILRPRSRPRVQSHIAAALAGPTPANSTAAQTMVLYQYYYGPEAWSSLKSEPPYRPICLRPGSLRPNTDDIDATQLLELLQDPMYEGLLCEYGAIFTVAMHLQTMQAATDWVGFQSWRAADRGKALSVKALERLAQSMAEHEARDDTSVFYFWSHLWQWPMYSKCDE